MLLFNNLSEVRKLLFLSKLLTLFACIIGIAGVVGWVFSFPFFTAIDSSFAPIKFSTSVALVLVSLSVIALHLKTSLANALTKAASIFTALTGTLALLEADLYTLPLNWSLSQMPVVPALVFIITGTILTLFSFGLISHKYLQLTAVIIFFILFKDLLVYLFSWDIFLGAGAYPSASLHSVIAITALSVSLLLVHPDKGYMAVLFSQSLTGTLARRLFIFTLFLPFLLLLFILFLHRQSMISPAEGLLWFALLYTLTGAIILWYNLSKIHSLEKINEESHLALNLLNKQLSATNQELFMANEELTSNNEELISLNEKLAEAGKTIERLSAEAIQASENKYKQLTDSISDIFFAFDQEMRFTYWNKASEKFSGLRSEQAIGKSLYQLYPTMRNTTAEKCYLEALRTGQYQSCVYESKFIGKIFEVNVYPSQTGISVFTKDITQAKRIEKELKEKEERFELALWAANMGAWDWDIPSGRIIFDEQCAESWGYRLQDLEPHVDFWIRMVHQEDLPYVNAVVYEHLEGSTPFYRTEHRIKSQTGQWKWIMNSGKAIEWDENRKPLRVVGTILDITERKKAEQAILESKKKYKGLFESMSEAVFMIEQANYKLVDVNPGACAMYQYSREEMFQLTPKDLTAEPDEAPSIIKNLVENVPLRYHKRKNGEIFPVEISLSYFQLQETNYVFVIMRDITKRILAEEELRMQKEILQSIFDHLPIMIALFNKQGEFELVNKEWETKLGWPLEDMQGKDMMAEFYPELQLRQEVLEYMLSAMPGWKYFKIRIRSGAWLDTSWANVKLSDGRSIGIGQDVSQRKQAESKLLELQNRIEGIINSAMDAIITTDDNQRVVLFNKAAERMFDIKEEEMLGKDIHSLIPGRFRAQYTQHIREFEFSGKKNRDIGLNLTIFGLHSSGKEFPLEASISQMLVEEKKYYTVILRDITLRKKAEHQEKQLNRELILQNQQLQQFGYITSHNLRAPIANILGLTQIFNMEDLNDPINKVAIENIRKATLKLDDIIKDLNEILAYQKSIDTSKELIHFEHVLNDVSEAIITHINHSKATIIADFSAISKVFSIKSYINSVFQNMLTNAIKYRHPERVPIIKITSALTQEHIQISFEDNGMGIDLEKNKDKIFGMYKRFHYHVEGKGLGLHLVKTQVEALHGKIDVNSTLGEGTIFHIFLPK
ncbi:PAS domain S-box protein [Rhodocytophaga rosea]|uniref:histidine kinase n=1 Tax=Rhodocytophaga rosea TaxID=2704465 RepID=A0A6C0GFX3_9BACT|nr:PAS domain S-box protein [Rhodocytophaga rosea]QHT66906.1 PAS domain S-box protein [Rhodocytophaga rosea]